MTIDDAKDIRELTNFFFVWGLLLFSWSWPCLLFSRFLAVFGDYLSRYATVVDFPIDVILPRSCTPSQGRFASNLSLLVRDDFFLYETITLNDGKSTAEHLHWFKQSTKFLSKQVTFSKLLKSKCPLGLPYIWEYRFCFSWASMHVIVLFFFCLSLVIKWLVLHTWSRNVLANKCMRCQTASRVGRDSFILLATTTA